MPVRSLQDCRLEYLDAFLKYLTDWKTETSGDSKRFLSDKLWFDIQSMIHGFRAIVAIKIKIFPQAVIKPAIINQDVVENHFCQVRACNGMNANPTWRLQENVQNTIRFGQTTISRKSNAGTSGLRKSTWTTALLLRTEWCSNSHYYILENFAILKCWLVKNDENTINILPY